MGKAGRVGKHNTGSVYLTLFLDALKLRNSLGIVRIETMVDALWMCIFHHRQALECSPLVLLHIFCVRLLLVVHSTIPGNAKASRRGMGNKFGSHASFLLISNAERVSHRHHPNTTSQ